MDEVKTAGGSGIAIYEQELMREVTGPAIRPGGLALTDRAMEFCGLAPESRVLDAGCGCGTTVGHLRERWGLAATGVDISTRLLSEGRQSGNLPLARGEISGLPTRSGVLDGLVCECVLSILPDPEKALREFRRVLKEEGFLILSDICLREEQGGPTARCPNISSPVSSCFSGAVSTQARSGQLESAGFSILLREDHTKLLKELAARFVFRHGSLKKFWQEILPCGCNADTEGFLAAGKPGYALWIARKT